MPGTPRLKDFASRELISFSPDTPVVDAVARLLHHGISGAPVLDASGKLVGILTAKDCFSAALNATYYQGWTGIVADYMAAEVQTLDADTDLVTAAQRFLQANFRRFPVVEDGRLIGLITRLDLLRALNAQWRR